MSLTLFDTNVLIALMDPVHARHADAHAWMTAHRAGGWATCPMVQNGCLRIMSHPRYGQPVPMADLARRLRGATSAPDHVFLADDISLLDPVHCDAAKLLSSLWVTDTYLLALAAHHGGRLLTLDRRLASVAACGAAADHLLVV